MLARALRLRTRDWGKIFARRRKYTLDAVSLLPPSECHTRCSDTEVHSFWCFLLADLSVGVQTAARAPLCPSLQESTGNQWEGVPSWRSRSRTKTSQVNRTEHIFFWSVAHHLKELAIVIHKFSIWPLYTYSRLALVYNISYLFNTSISNRDYFQIIINTN